MSSAVADKTEYIIKSPELRGGNLALGACRDRMVCFDGPAGTGKTIAALYKIHILLLAYPNTRALVARKSNTALAGSAMATYRNYILDDHEGVRYFGGNKVKPAAFLYPNGSELVINGLDKPSKVRSTEFEWAFINEATECTTEDVEFVHMRLRPRAGGPEVPYRQLIMDCNPDAPTHWLNQFMNEGRITRIISRHQDNPRYFDSATQDWTDEGREYIEGILGNLTGVRLARYRYGLWSAAEGTVFQDSWDRATNVIDPFPIPREWPRYLVIDFGYTHAFVCKWYAEDHDGRFYCYREHYMTKKLVEDHAKIILIASGWYHNLPREHPKYARTPPQWADPLPREVICDHDAEDRATFERHTHLYTTAAKKSVSDGLQAMASRLRVAGDGKPRLMYFRNALIQRDEELAQAKKPTSGLEEFDVYVWKRDASGAKEEPVKENDHSIDCDRYLCAHKDLQQRAVERVKSPWR